MIGVFDSGFGGLTILRALLAEKKLAKYDYLYLGDSARAPYGDKSDEVIYEYTRQAIDCLFGCGCSLIILACNTASARALRKIQQEYLPKKWPDRRVLGVIVPIVEEITEKYADKKIGVIGTRATIDSHTYKKEIALRNSQIQVHEQACPLLVPLIEEGWLDKPETKSILAHYLAPLKKAKIDLLIPGCTHYPLLLNQIRKIVGPKVDVLDVPKLIAQKTVDYLQRNSQIKQWLYKKGRVIIATTDDPKHFQKFGEQFLGRRIGRVTKMTLN